MDRLLFFLTRRSIVLATVVKHHSSIHSTSPRTPFPDTAGGTHDRFRREQWSNLACRTAFLGMISLRKPYAILMYRRTCRSPGWSLTLYLLSCLVFCIRVGSYHHYSACMTSYPVLPRVLLHKISGSRIGRPTCRRGISWLCRKQV